MSKTSKRLTDIFRPLSPFQLLAKGCALSLPRKRVIRLTDRLDMTIVADWDVKHKERQKYFTSDLSAIK